MAVGHRRPPSALEPQRLHYATGATGLESTLRAGSSWSLAPAGTSTEVGIHRLPAAAEGAPASVPPPRRDPPGSPATSTQVRTGAPMRAAVELLNDARLPPAGLRDEHCDARAGSASYLVERVGQRSDDALPRLADECGARVPSRAVVRRRIGRHRSIMSHRRSLRKQRRAKCLARSGM